MAITVEHIDLRVTGIAPLIVHRWSEKAKREMLEKQTKQNVTAKEAKDPKQDYEDSLYYCDDGTYGFPVIAFKAAAVRAGTDLGYKMTDLRRAFHLSGTLTTIFGSPQMREDMVRVSMGKADIRYRAEFPEWSTTLSVDYKPTSISREQLIALFDEAGFSVGIGEWRPERSGSYGRFTVTA